MVLLLQPLYHCLFHNGLDIGGAEKLALNGGGFGNPEPAVLRDIIFPGDFPDALEQFFKCFCMELACFQQYPFCGAQEHIPAADGFRVPFKGNAPIFHMGNFIPKVIYFSF